MRFLGMVGLLQELQENFSFVENEWSLPCQQAFENFKRLLSSAPVLATQRFGSPFQIQVDASQVGAGAVLLHTTENGVDHPVSYSSSKFNSHQEYYSTIENETFIQHIQGVDNILVDTFPVLLVTLAEIENLSILSLSFCISLTLNVAFLRREELLEREILSVR